MLPHQPRGSPRAPTSAPTSASASHHSSASSHAVAAQGSQPPLRSALKTDDEDGGRTPSLNGSIKAVQIHEPESNPSHDDEPGPSSSHHSSTRRRFLAHVGLARRLSGKSTISTAPSHSSLATSLGPGPEDQSQPPAPHPDDPLGRGQADGQNPAPSSEPSPHSGPHRGQRYYHQKLLSQLAEWLDHERRKLETRGNRRPAASASACRQKSTSPAGSSGGRPGAQADQKSISDIDHHGDDPAAEAGSGLRYRADSMDSLASEVSLDRLQRIIEDSMAAMGVGSASDLSFSPRTMARRHRKKLTRHKLQRTQSSDTEYNDGDVVVPTCDAVLDNSRTLEYTGGGGGDVAEHLPRREAKKARQNWISFKDEIIRLAHTLRLKGWRRVPLASGGSVTVKRLSGALTNAVYLVSPPAEVATRPDGEVGKQPAANLLLRIYGPNVETLIDRENELNVLRRLARKKIGPRLLGTFTNGRFEQYFNSTTLTPSQLREPETSRQIAKRMRELHDGIALLPEERAAGPGLWKNWERWLGTVETRIAFLDDQARAAAAAAATATGSDQHLPGFVCGTEWAQFRAALDRYRAYVDQAYQSPGELRDRLVFAHNDTQYGNILRVRPDDETSPLLHPENEHKQLVVIDFEYAGPNTRGFEFANHFTEWTYNYHDTAAPHRCNTSLYPTVEQQNRFLRGYIEHSPKIADQDGSDTPRMAPVAEREATHSAGGPSSSSSIRSLGGGPSASSIVEFMLDARVPPGGWREAERKREEGVDQKVEELRQETRLWRAGCSAQWVVWGIVQAKIEGLNLSPAEDGPPGAAAAGADGASSEGDAGAETEAAAAAAGTPERDAEEEEFDYLSYARERAMFFWGDLVLLGLVREEELADDVRRDLKMVDH